MVLCYLYDGNFLIYLEIPVFHDMLFDPAIFDDLEHKKSSPPIRDVYALAFLQAL